MAEASDYKPNSPSNLPTFAGRVDLDILNFRPPDGFAWRNEPQRGGQIPGRTRPPVPFFTA